MKYLDYLKLYFDESGDGDGDGAGDNGQQNDNKGAGDKNGNQPGGGTDDKNKPKYTDEDIDRIIEKKFAKWKKQQAAAVDEATRLANMNAQERAEHERDKLQKELDDLKRANTIAEMEKTARGMFADDGLTVPDAIVSVLVDEDADKTSENVKAFSKAVKKMVQDEVKRQLTHKAPSGSQGAGTLTKADIMKEKDPLKRQKLIRENMSLFRN